MTSVQLGFGGWAEFGKTTAKAFYNKHSKKFEISCFIEDIKQNSQGGGSTLLGLLEQLLIELLKRKDYKVLDVESGIRRLKKILCSSRVLIVLDDLDQSSYWKLLVRLCNFFSAGSRIMITTRDEKMLNQLKVHMSEVDVYKLKKLGQKESLELFSYHAFGKITPTKSFRELSLSFVRYAGGLPLALMVLGSSLCGSTCVSFWKAKLEKVRQISDNDIQKVLQLSYDELGDEEKAIFLDIVFFFVGKSKDEAVHIFKSCHFFPVVGIPILVQRCLLKIDDNNNFKMHNLIQDMGREVIREESKNGKCRRLYLCEGNAFEGSQNLEGAEKIEGLILDLTMSTNRQVSAKIFEKLQNLRLLQIIHAHGMNGNFKNLFHELRCIRWHYCPWTCLPSSFRPQKLVSLDIPFSEFKTLWKDAMSHVNLKTIDVSYSKKLKTTPNFRNAKLVEKLSFRGCTSLQKVHPTIGELTNLGHLDLRECNQLIELPKTIGQLTKLGHLDMSDCVKLKRLPDSIKQLTILSSLVMRRCRNLKRLPEQLGDIKGLKELDAGFTAIEKLPDSITHLKELVGLNLNGCKKLKKLPEQFGNLDGLEWFHAVDSALEELPDSFVCLINLARLNLRCCSKLERLPEQIGKLQCLEELYAYSTVIEELPDSIGLLSMLKELNLNSCKRLTYLPNSLGNLTSLERLYLEGIIGINLNHLDFSKCNQLIGLPRTIVQLSKLGHLDLRACMKLKRLPEQLGDIKGLKKLDASYTAIEQLPDSITLLKELVWLDVYSCKKLKKLPEQFGNLEGLEGFNAGDSALEELPDSFVCLINLAILNLRDCSKLERLPEQIGKLQCLQGIDACSTAIEELPDSIGLLSRLQGLYLSRCKRLTYLPNSLGNLISLESLQLEGMRGINFPDTLINMKLLYLGLSSLSLWPIPTFSSLKVLCLSDEGQSFSNHEDIKCKSFGSSLPDLPPTLERLSVYDHATLEQLPDLSSYEQLRELDIQRCSSLQTISLLPPRLEEFYVFECPSLQNLPDLSLLKEMKFLRVTKCSNLKSVSLKESSLKVGPDEYSSFRARILNREIAEWFSYKSSGPSVSFYFPPILGDNFLGVAFWAVYKIKSLEPSYIRAVITNKTEDITVNYENIPLANVVGEAQSWVQCLRGEKLLVKSGDRINVSFQNFLFSGQQVDENYLEVKCGAHVIQNTVSFF